MLFRFSVEVGYSKPFYHTLSRQTHHVSICQKLFFYLTSFSATKLLKDYSFACLHVIFAVLRPQLLGPHVFAVFLWPRSSGGDCRATGVVAGRSWGQAGVALNPAH